MDFGIGWSKSLNTLPRRGCITVICTATVLFIRAKYTEAFIQLRVWHSGFWDFVLRLELFAAFFKMNNTVDWLPMLKSTGESINLIMLLMCRYKKDSTWSIRNAILGAYILVLCCSFVIRALSLAQEWLYIMLSGFSSARGYIPTYTCEYMIRVHV